MMFLITWIEGEDVNCCFIHGQDELLELSGDHMMVQKIAM
jgi:hypothetical protein